MAAPRLDAVPAAERETVESANKYGIDPAAYPAYFHSSSCPASSNRLFGFANPRKPPFVLQRYDEPRDLRPCAETAELLGTAIQRRPKMPEKQADVQVSKIDFDTDNPRIKKALEKYGGQLTPQQIHFALRSAANGPASSFSSLKDSIRASKGILSPITLIRRAERYICIDGNTRLAIYREFDKENVAGDWSRIKSLIIEGATQPDIEMRRVSAHLVGAREWPAYEKARYLHYLRNEKLWDYGRLIELCGGNKAEIERQIDAYHDIERARFI